MNPESKKESDSKKSILALSLPSPLKGHTSKFALAIAGILSALGANNCGAEFTAADPDPGTVDGGTPDGEVNDGGPDSTPDASDCDFIRVSDSPLSPGNQTIPKGASNVTWTCWTFENGCKNNEIEKVTLTKSGSGQNEDLEELFLTDVNGTVLSGPVSLNETAKIELTDNWLLPADTATNICARVNVSPDASSSGTHIISINLPADIETDIPAEGDFPLTGNALTISNATVGTATIQKNGVLAPGPADSEQFIIGQFSILVDSIEDGQLEQIRVRLPANCGTEDMQNFNIIDQNSPLPIATEPAATASGYATFNLATPLTLNSGSQLDFWATADLNCQPGDTIKSCIADESDVVITGNTYGYNLRIINNHDCQTNAQEVVLQ